MVKFIARHTAGFLVTLILVSLIIAAIFSFLPGDPAVLVGGIGASPEQLESLRMSLGLNLNIFQRYLLWVRTLFTSQTAVSLQYGMPVYRLLGDRLAVTSSIALLACALMVLIACPLGILAAYRKNTWVDSLVSNLTILGLSVPNYLTGILLIWVWGILL
ncbi:MAG: ABC transporter permease, partial [Spirochaetaceae bacterium]|nr:ABC transporter permease [Spirochaetaceae bacterium]